MINKLTLGTAQFGMPYGLSKKEVNLEEVDKILNYSKKIGIKSLDTAPSYNNSLKKLGSLNINGWKIISKIPSIPRNIIDKNKWIEEIFLDILKKLKVSNIDTILLHNEDDILYKKYGDEIFKTLQNFKKNKLVKNLGCSIYTPKKIKKIINRYDFDVIQAPFNIFDKRVITSGLYSSLIKKKIKLDIRSIFLQGLLLRNNNNPKIFKNNKFLFQFNAWIKLNNFNSLNACLSMATKINFNRLIIGVHSLSQLKEVIKYSSKNIATIPDFDISEKNILLDPRKW